MPGLAEAEGRRLPGFPLGMLGGSRRPVAAVGGGALPGPNGKGGGQCPVFLPPRWGREQGSGLASPPGDAGLVQDVGDDGSVHGASPFAHRIELPAEPCPPPRGCAGRRWGATGAGGFRQRRSWLGAARAAVMRSYVAG